MAIIFWCEFPEEVDWDKVNKQIDFDTEIYITCKNKKEYLNWKKKVKNKHIVVGAWPVLDKKDGYWFSGQTSKEDIDKLDEFKDVKIKIDIEPRIYEGKYSNFKALRWGLRWLVNPGENTSYLINKVNSLYNKKVIVSGAFFPKWIRKRIGQDANGKKNFICYTSMMPGMRWLILAYCRFMIKRTSKDSYFAIGLANHGIFGNEKEYRNKEEFIKDLEFMKKLNVKNIVIYSLEGVMKRDWLGIVKNYISSF